MSNNQDDGCVGALILIVILAVVGPIVFGFIVKAILFAVGAAIVIDVLN